MKHLSLLRLSAVLLALLTFVSCGLRPSFTGTVVGVHDGDSITVVTATRERIKVRLDGIDAPELGQAHGQAAKASLSELVFGKEVRVRVNGADKYRRTLGDVFLGENWINQTQVRNGFAWQYDQYNRDFRLGHAERLARQQRQGLWQDRRPKPPWEWRKARR